MNTRKLWCLDWGGDPSLPSTVEKALHAHRDQGQEHDVHLRSFNEVKTYALRAIDGEIGQLDDLLIEPETWRMTHVIADARKWWPGGQVVIDGWPRRGEERTSL
ncbi:MAG TPA: hypothetical protein VE954_15760 [Oligoflexus sp.]|uniref:hypothetical protein n=1 Tax=Oligoflexus sp. TaxID=1971216 RepID=UPI002D3676F1|nr:hypothetical protein [Oligoflexus sp.]HYX34558.1 hypothetical protein [Oligoflexus sp.]